MQEKWRRGWKPLPSPFPRAVIPVTGDGTFPKHIWPGRGLDGELGPFADDETTGLGGPESRSRVKQPAGQAKMELHSVALHLFTSTKTVRLGEKDLRGSNTC